MDKPLNLHPHTAEVLLAHLWEYEAELDGHERYEVGRDSGEDSDAFREFEQTLSAIRDAIKALEEYTGYELPPDK